MLNVTPLLSYMLRHHYILYVTPSLRYTLRHQNIKCNIITMQHVFYTVCFLCYMVSMLYIFSVLFVFYARHACSSALHVKPRIFNTTCFLSPCFLYHMVPILGLYVSQHYIFLYTICFLNYMFSIPHV